MKLFTFPHCSGPEQWSSLPVFSEVAEWNFSRLLQYLCSGVAAVQGVEVVHSSQGAAPRMRHDAEQVEVVPQFIRRQQHHSCSPQHTTLTWWFPDGRDNHFCLSVSFVFASLLPKSLRNGRNSQNTTVKDHSPLGSKAMAAMDSDVCAGKCATRPSPSESSCTLIYSQKQTITQLLQSTR